jgi:hypothetical protein
MKITRILAAIAFSAGNWLSWPFLGLHEMRSRMRRMAKKELEQVLLWHY